jgi:isopenicillin-N N-acyltransferase like protein
MSPRGHVEIDSIDPFERGRQRGVQVAARLQETWPIYQSLFDVTARDAGRPPVDIAAVAHACLDVLSSWSPELLRELEGVSSGAGASLTTLMALNARTEVFAVAGGTEVTECSTLVELTGPRGSVLSAQTWDWHEELAAGWHVQSVNSGERSYVGLTEFGMLAKIGVNSAGLGVHFNLLRHEIDAQPASGEPGSPRPGVPVHLLAAAILDTAATVAEATDLVRSAPIAASTVITVVAPDEAACLELSPAGIGVVEPDDGWLVHTNHFLDPRLAEGEAVTQFVTTTFERAELLRSRVKAASAPQDLDELTELLRSHDEDGVAVCRHPGPDDPHGYRTATLATVALDPERREARVFADGPCRPTDVAVLRAEA